MLGYYDRLIELYKKDARWPLLADDRSTLNVTHLLSGADEFCRRVEAMGVRQGEHVALCAFNSCSWLCAFLGIVKAGAVAVLFNYSSPLSELQERMEDMDCRILLYGRCSAEKKDPDFAAKLQPDAELRLDIDSAAIPLHTEFTAQGLSEEALASPAFIIFSSGSTGKPKGVMLSQKCNVAGADAFTQILPELAGESMCLALPLFHIYGLSMTMAHILNGGFVSLPSDFAPTTLLNMLDRYRTDALAAVMTVITRLGSYAGLDECVGRHSVRRIYTGGAQLLPIHILRASTCFDNAVLLNGYGQTESDSCIAMTVPSDSMDKRSYSVGRPLPHRTVRIVDSEDRELPAGSVGEVVVRDEGLISNGYYALPPEKQSIRDGWLHTGDVGYFDEDGYLHLEGRIKDIIIKGGENVVPSKIELAISRLDGVRDVKVIGAPHELYGETIMACVCPEDGVRLTEAELLADLRRTLPRFLLPEHFFFFDSFPLRPNGKLDVLELKQRMLRQLNLLRIDEELSEGIGLISVYAKSQRYIIAPLCEAVNSIIAHTGFTAMRAERIHLCVEEMLTACSNSAFLEEGNVGLEVRLYRDFMRVQVSCNNTHRPFGNAGEKQTLSERLIYAFTDRVSQEDGDLSTVYHFDYVYDKEFDAKEFIAQ